MKKILAAAGVGAALIASYCLITIAVGAGDSVLSLAVDYSGISGTEITRVILGEVVA
jgi:hypothetical protein